MDSCGMIFSVPGSKSILQRLLVLLAHSKGELCVHNYNACDDVLEMERALQIFGYEVDRSRDMVNFRYSEARHRQSTHDYSFEASATAYRLWIGVLANLPGIRSRVKASKLLHSRGIAPLCSALRSLGAGCREIDNSLIIDGIALPGGILSPQMHLSSQFASSLLLAAPFMKDDLTLRLPANPVSMPYLRLSAAMLRLFGARVDDVLGQITVERGQYNMPEQFTVDSDLSSAAFLAIQAALGREIAKLRLFLNPEIEQPDMAIWNILREMGARIETVGNVYRIHPSALHGISLDLTDTPDLMPVLSITALFCNSPSRFSGIGRLIHKESNRLLGICKALDLLGAQYRLEEDAISILPLVTDVPACTLDTQQDHRLVMAFSLVRMRYSQVRISEKKSLSKSVPCRKH
mgnify:FL=1